MRRPPRLFSLELVPTAKFQIHRTCVQRRLVANLNKSLAQIVELWRLKKAVEAERRRVFDPDTDELELEQVCVGYCGRC